VERTREFGEVYLGLALWRRLGLHEFLRELLQEGRESVPWEPVACVLKLARFCAQRSELGIAESWYERTALEDLLAVDAAQMNDDRHYRGLDLLGEHKEQLCAHLMERYRDWFGVRFEFPRQRGCGGDGDEVRRCGGFCGGSAARCRGEQWRRGVRPM